jgi:hypothetical protein
MAEENPTWGYTWIRGALKNHFPSRAASASNTLTVDQPFNTFPKYWRRLSLSRFPLIDDGFAGSRNLFGELRLG